MLKDWIVEDVVVLMKEAALGHFSEE